MVKSAKALLAAALAALGACDGSGQGPVEAARPPERSAAYSLVTQLAAIAEQPTETARLLQAADFTALVTLAAPPDTPVATPSAAAPDGTLAGCLLATGTAATLSECELGDHVIDGTWSMQRQRLHAELVDVFVVDDTGHRGSLWIDANLSTAGDLDGSPVDGTVEVSLMWTMDGQDHALDASLRIEGLVVEAPGCATGGTITISGRLVDTASTTTALWFGPGCRDVHISRHTSR